MLRRLLLILAAAHAWAPAEACDTGPFKIFYDSGSDRLPEDGRRTLDYMRDLAGAGGTIRLSGHTDTAGRAEDNLRLAKRRVETARTFLIRLGLPPGRIITESFGESRSITALDDGSVSSRHRYILVEVLSAVEVRKGRMGRHSATCGG